MFFKSNLCNYFAETESERGQHRLDRLESSLRIVDHSYPNKILLIQAGHNACIYICVTTYSVNKFTTIHYKDCHLSTK